MRSAASTFALVCALALQCVAGDNKCRRLNVHCLLKKEDKLECIVDVRPGFGKKRVLRSNYDKKEFYQIEHQDSKFDLCGSTELKFGSSRNPFGATPPNYLEDHTPPRGVTCPANRGCLCVNREALVRAALHYHYTHQILDDEEKPIRNDRIYGTTKKNTKPIAADSSFKYLFKADIKTVGPATEGITATLPLTTDMLTNLGFITVNFGGPKFEDFRGPPPHVPGWTGKHYMGVSGGGWRALSAAMGAFRALGKNGFLKKVDMFSSVSGGTWFLSKVSFDDEFADKVFSDMPIGDVIQWWLETRYFPVIRQADEKPKGDTEAVIILRQFLSTFASQAAVSALLGHQIIAAQHFDYSWQKMVEAAVMGEPLATTKLSEAKLPEKTQANFKDDVLLSFNYNQMHQWEGKIEGVAYQHPARWYLEKKTAGDITHPGGNDGAVQYPVFTSAQFKRTGAGNGGTVSVKSKGKKMSDLYKICKQTVTDKASTNCDWDFDFEGLTVGQTASASSAAAGGASIRSWVRNLIKLARKKVNVLLCAVSIGESVINKLLKLIFSDKCGQRELLKVIDKILCGKEVEWGSPSALEAEKWAHMMHKMAIPMSLKRDGAQEEKSYMAIDGGYTDNGGIAPILQEHLNGKENGQAFFLMLNSLGDTQMESYFGQNYAGLGYGGQICASGWDDKDNQWLHGRWDREHRKTFKSIPGKYVKNTMEETFNDETFTQERTCAMRLAGTLFFEGPAPLHRRFGGHISRHITFSYQAKVVIKKNDFFYNYPTKYLDENGKGNREIDVLFLNINAPVSTAAFPIEGSNAYHGLARGVELATIELRKKFPNFFGAAAPPGFRSQRFRSSQEALQAD